MKPACFISARAMSNGLVLHPDHPTRHIHHKATRVGSGHAAADQDFLHAVAQSVADAGRGSHYGPSSAKTELINTSMSTIRG